MMVHDVSFGAKVVAGASWSVGTMSKSEDLGNDGAKVVAGASWSVGTMSKFEGWGNAKAVVAFVGVVGTAADWCASYAGVE